MKEKIALLSWTILGLVVVAVLVVMWKTSNLIFVPKDASAAVVKDEGYLEGNNSLVVSDEVLYNLVEITQLKVEKPGFVGIWDERNGEPGRLLGASMLIEAKVDTRADVYSFRKLVSGESIYVTLYQDDGDGVFNQDKDGLILDEYGNPIWVKIRAVVREN